MNPRLDPDWLRYLVTVGAREDAEGWRWKIDPTVRFGGFGPWRPEWSMMRLPDIGVPVLAILGAAPDPMGWGTPPSDVLSHMPPGGRLEVLDDVGHFVHIEQPRVVADLVLEHLA
jgi:pimeloyl-ACP methyl ester carboxylesterase